MLLHSADSRPQGGAETPPASPYHFRLSKRIHRRWTTAPRFPLALRVPQALYYHCSAGIIGNIPGRKGIEQMLSDAKVVAILLSDMTVREAGTGKLSLINCFSCFNADKFPFQTPVFFVTVFLTNLEGKPDEINLTIRIESPKNGHVHTSASVVLKPVPDTPPISRDDVVEIPFRLRTSLPDAGIYTVKLLLDNQDLDLRSFRVIARTSSTQIGQEKVQ